VATKKADPQGVARYRTLSHHCRLQRAPGNGVMAPRRSNSAHLHRPWCVSFSLFCSAIYAPGPKHQLCLIRVSKQSGGKSSPKADSLATDDVGRKLASLRTAIVSISSWIGARRPPLMPIRVGYGLTRVLTKAYRSSTGIIVLGSGFESLPATKAYDSYAVPRFLSIHFDFPPSLVQTMTTPAPWLFHSGRAIS
jgi:hypothetical protein